MDKKRIRELAKQEGLTYMQALQKYRSPKPVLSPFDAAWQSLQRRAQALGVELEPRGSEFFLAHHGVACSCPRTLEGIQQAEDWLEQYAEENIEE